MTVEAHTVKGGLGTMTVEALAAHDVRTALFEHSLRDEYVLVGPPTRLYCYYGLDPAEIATIGVCLLAREDRPPLVTEPLWTADDRRKVYDKYGVPR